MGSDAKDDDKSKAQLLQELLLLRRRLAQLEEDRSKYELCERSLRESDQRVRQKLASILSPEGDIGNLELGDIIDVPSVQSLLNDFHALTRFPVSIIDVRGKLLAGVGWQDICTNFHRVHPETCQHCLESDTQLSAGVPPGEFRLYKCKNNMWDIATPILLGGKKLGNLFSGQFFFAGEPLDYDLFRSQARQYGFNETEYIAALERVPRLTRESVEAGMAFLVKLAHMLSLQSYSNIKLARSLAERDSLMETLRVSLRFLELAHIEQDFDSLLNAFVSEIKDYTGCEAIGIRVLDIEGGIPYLAYCGFRKEFYEKESPLSIKTDHCMCINVIKGDFDPELPFYSSGGSFYINGTTRFLAKVSEADKGRTRNVCNLEGYESVALIPLRRGDRILGLIHVADKRENMVPLPVVEMLEKAGMQLGTALSRMQAEEGLRESEKKFRGLVENMTEGVALHELIYEDDGKAVDYRIIATNPAFEKHTGLKPEQVTGQLASSAYGIRPAPYLETYAQVALSGQPSAFETFFPQMERYLHISVTSPKQGQFVTVFEDITERKRIEDAVAAERQRFYSLLEAMPAYLGLLTPDYQVAFANRYFRERFGEPEGRPCYEYMFGRSEPCENCLAYKVLETKRPEEYEWSGPDGRTYQICDQLVHDTDGSPLILEMGIDITERKRMEEALRDSEQFLTDIFNSIQDGLSILDTDFNIIRVNPAMEKLGYAQPMVGRKCYEVYHDQSSPCKVCPTQETLRTGKVCREIIMGHPADGAKRFYEVHTFPLKDRTSDQVKAVIEYVRDVTLIKQAEEDRLRFSKLESLATLAGGIAHDFNNILTAILGNIGLATLDLQNEKLSRERLTDAERACLQAQTLARQLLTFAKGGAPVKEPISVEKVITEATSFSCRGSQVRCEFVFADNLWAVEADPGQINQVFQNLLINAIQAMPTGGTIKIRGENLVAAADDDVGLDRGRYVKVSVADQGVGMPEDFLEKIFDPYFTTKQKGSGLGLATVYSIVKNHHGHISVQSELGEGTVFEVYLPAGEQNIIPAPEEDRGLLTGKGKILVMDDEEMVRQVLARMLARLGYETEFASCGNEAVEQFIRARESGEAFAAVILDLTVPGGMGGKEVVRKLLEIDPQVRAIVSSGYFDAPIMAEYKKYGFTGIIAKPYKVSELSKVLHRVIFEKI